MKAKMTANEKATKLQELKSNIDKVLDNYKNLSNKGEDYKRIGNSAIRDFQKQIEEIEGCEIITEAEKIEIEEKAIDDMLERNGFIL